MRAKHLLSFVRQSRPSPRGQLWEPGGVNSWRYAPSQRASELASQPGSSRCLFPLPKGSSMLRSERNVSGANVHKQPSAPDAVVYSSVSFKMGCKWSVPFQHKRRVRLQWFRVFIFFIAFVFFCQERKKKKKKVNFHSHLTVHFFQVTCPGHFCSRRIKVSKKRKTVCRKLTRCLREHCGLTKYT